MKNVVLIGMPGCGKSTCGVLVAKALCMDFVDTDLLIQQKEKMPLQAIIDQKGEGCFEQAEESAVCGLSVSGAVIATGGSVVYSQKAMAHLKQNGFVVYLNVSFQTMLKRIADIKSRGILLKQGETLEAMFKSRGALYSQYADFVLDCDDKSIESTVSEIVNLVS